VGLENVFLASSDRLSRCTIDNLQSTTFSPTAAGPARASLGGWNKQGNQFGFLLASKIRATPVSPAACGSHSLEAFLRQLLSHPVTIETLCPKP